MNLAGQIDKLVQRGFTEERAETIVLMREAAILLFDAFPEMLVVVGGANLVLFQEGVRHSADLDFFPVAGELREIASLKEVLSNGLKDTLCSQIRNRGTNLGGNRSRPCCEHKICIAGPNVATESRSLSFTKDG